MKLSHSEAEKSKSSSNRKLMLFDLVVGGHHGSYIQHLVEYWCQEELSGSLDIVVSPKFLQVHSDVVDIASKCARGNINFVAITHEEEAVLKSGQSSVSRTFHKFQEWDLFCKYASLLRSDRGLIMYFDTCKLPLAFGVKSPCPFSGIYFRPTFHYGEFTSYLPSIKDRAQQWQEKLTLSRVLNHSELQTLFCLDPFAVKHIDKFFSKAKVVHLPDPVRLNSESELQVENLREKLGIHPDKIVFLLFGALADRRKGVHQLLEAVRLLPTNLCQKLCLLFVGGVDDPDRNTLESLITSVCESQPVQVIGQYEYVTETDVQKYFQLADVVLAPYQRHVGMSGILLLAAVAQKPVLSSNYGLMGEIVQRYSLGLTVDSTRASAIANGLTRFLIESPEKFCYRANMQVFAEQNSARNYAKTIFYNL
jgi:glycosyltransferase involved in cell wall biosynthesis